MNSVVPHPPAMWRPLLGVLVAIAITTALDATGFSAYSALPLMPLLFLFWRLEGLSRRSVGFVAGQLRHYGLAVLYPVVVLGAVAAISIGADAVDLSHTDWRKTWLNVALVGLSTILVAIVTEEGFFRGWLFASLERAGVQRTQAVLLLSSIAFSLWHLSAVTLNTGFDLPAAQVPVFMLNAAVLGLNWGLLRVISGSVFVASVSHGVWNGAAYAFFGFGTKIGALGIANTAVFGPESGVVGLALNVLVAVVLWRTQRLQEVASV